jgi:alpha-L-arabinofuranosidase
VSSSNPLAQNTLAEPDRVTPQSDELKLDDDLTIELPPSSYSIIELTTTAPVAP